MFKKMEINNALEKEKQPDGSSVMTIDAYDGCSIQYPYCFQMNNKEWSRDIYIRTNITDVLQDQLLSLESQNTELYIGSLSDPYMDIEKEYKLTHSILGILKDRDLRVLITTIAVNGLILRDLEVLRAFKIPPIVSIGLSHIEQADKGAAHYNIYSQSAL